MARLRGRPLSELSQADMEAIEERVERAALNRHLAEIYGEPEEPQHD